MKPSKIQAADEAGRNMAEKRYGAVAHKSAYGHAKMDHNMRGKFDMPTPAAHPTSKVEASKHAKHVPYDIKGDDNPTYPKPVTGQKEKYSHG
jgi:hypothetical protein